VAEAPAQVAIAAAEVSARPASAATALAAPPVPAPASSSAAVAADPPSRIAVARVGPQALKPPADEREAFSYYRRLALDGHAEAQFRLGELYATGRGVGQSLNQAYLWYGMAARAGHTQAQARQTQLGAKLQPAEVRQVERYLQRTAPASSEAAQ
jgi:TPR repeat protein